MTSLNKKNIITICLSMFFLIINPDTTFCQKKDSFKYDRLYDLISIKEGMKIGEAGAGMGYLTFSLSKKVGKTGIVYANDIDKSALDTIKKICINENINNITTVLGDLADPLFPEIKLDMIIMLKVFHDLEKPVEWLNNTKKYVKPGADLVIMDLDPNRFRTPFPDHFMEEEKVISLLKEAGFRKIKVDKAHKHFNIYITKFK